MIERTSLTSRRNAKKSGNRSDKINRAGKSSAALLSFFFTALLLTALYAVLEYYPFGANSVIVSDLGAQYAPDLIAYKNQLLSGDFSSYSFFIGMGKNVFGLFAYYLSSPLNFVTFLFPTAMISEAVLLLMGIKLSLASAFMTLFLRRRFRPQSGFAIVFGIMYAFCSYAMIYMINIMWLDGFFLLPLLLFFVEQFLTDYRHWWRVTLTLLVLFVSGFYIAYMVGIFSFLYLLVRLFEKNQNSGDKVPGAKRSILLFVGSAILAAGMSAALLLPAGMDILGNPDQSAKSFALDSNFKFIDFLNQLFAGSFDSLSNNKPLVYCGLVILFLIILFFMNPVFSGKQKALAGGSIIFFVLSFNLSFLDLAWQLFDSPNWFLYRYSFLLVFVLLMIAYASILHLKSLQPKMFVITGLIYLALLLTVQGFGDLSEAGDRFYINLVMGSIELLCLYAMSGVVFHASIANLKKLVPALLVIIICIEVVCVNPLFMRRVFGGYSDRETLASAISQGQELAAAAKDNDPADTSFYRMETDSSLQDGLHPMNAGLYLHYRPISTFNSSSNKDLNRMLKQLGYYTNHNYFTSSHTYTSPVTDSLLGIRYILSEKEDLRGYELIAVSSNSELFLQENNQALPLIYSVKNDAADFDFFALEKNPENKNPFQFQDALLVSLFGSEAFAEPVYYEAEVPAPVLYNTIVKEGVPEPDDDADAKDSTLSDNSQTDDLSTVEDTDLLGEEPAADTTDYGTTYLRLSSNDILSLTYSVKIESEDPLFLSIPAVAKNDQSYVYVDGEPVAELTSSSYTQIVSLGSFETGETVSVAVSADVDTYSHTSVLFYYCDTALFEKELSSAVSGQEVEITAAEDGYVSAEVTARKDQLLLTTIPYEDGWTLWVDGEETMITPYQNALISVPVSEGTHTISLSFTAPGLWAGIIAAGISGLIFAGALIYTYKSKKSNSSKEPSESNGSNGSNGSNKSNESKGESL